MTDNDTTIPTNDDDTEGHMPVKRGLSDAGTDGDDTAAHMPVKRGLEDAGTEGDDAEGHTVRGRP